PRTRPDRVLADKAYGSRANRAYLRRRAIARTIPEKADQDRNRKKLGRARGRPPAFDPERHKHGHAVGTRSQPAQAPRSHRPPLRQARRPLRGGKPPPVWHCRHPRQLEGLVQPTPRTYEPPIEAPARL